MDRYSLVYKGMPPNHCCCDQCLRILPNGEWVVIFMTGGAGEPELANHIRLCRSLDEGRTWGAAEVVKQFPDRACLLSECYLHGERLVVFMETHAGYFDDWRVFTIASDDGGHTWSEPEVFAPAPRRAFIRNLYVASWGEWYLPIQSYDTVADWQASPLRDGTFRAPFNAVLISPDEGRTWTQSGRVEPAHAWAENNVVELRDGRLVMLVRHDGAGCLMRSDSRDRGRTWSPAERTDIPNPGSKFRLHRLSDGRIVLVHNATNGQPRSVGRNCNVARNPLSLWVSDDDLQSWVHQRDLTDFPGMVAYPDGVVDAAEQYVHFVFDYNRHDVIYWGAELPSA